TRELLAVADRHAQGRLVSTLEGGYDLAALAASAAAHVRELMAVS
ncbi:MAG: histone deacetylase family protein, partial [Alphaproteobacteria bacterium]|nr:histone deacetylase family protein [Alphaproteobacteria bacterium]